MAKRTTETVHRLKVTLLEVEPPVWRRLDVPSQIKLSALAGVLEAAVGWYGGHLHGFAVGALAYGIPDPDFGSRTIIDERKVRLGEVLPAVTDRMRWDYDFGDGWEHEVLVEAIEPPDPGVAYPVCRAGMRACPPEDCGGPWGYDDFLVALVDPAHERHEELREWAPPGFDPEAFDIEQATQWMRSAAPPQSW